jgi:hypothetical protein
MKRANAIIKGKIKSVWIVSVKILARIPPYPVYKSTKKMIIRADCHRGISIINSRTPVIPVSSAERKRSI